MTIIVETALPVQRTVTKICSLSKDTTAGLALAAGDWDLSKVHSKNCIHMVHIQSASGESCFGAHLFEKVHHTCKDN